jgi:hypothetical protein
VVLVTRITPKTSPHALEPLALAVAPSKTSTVAPKPPITTAPAPDLRLHHTRVTHAHRHLQALPSTVTTPPFHLEAALTDPAFKPKDPATLPIPTALLENLLSAKRLLLVSHIQTDGDAVGSSLALAKTLRALGKQVDICIDDDLPGALRHIDQDHDIHRAAALTGRSWDLAVLLDVSVASRIGQANTLLLPHANAVAIVDHHEGTPQAHQFNLSARVPFTTWMAPDAPATGLMVGGLIGRMSRALVAQQQDLAPLYAPALLAFSTDTGWGKYQGLNASDFRYYKYMLQAGSGTSYAGLKRAANGYLVPARVQHLANRTLAPTEAQLPATLAAELDALQNSARGYHVSHFEIGRAHV